MPSVFRSLVLAVVFFGVMASGFLATDLARSSPPLAGTSFVTNKTLGTLRNDFTGWVGMRFTVGATPLRITALGRIFVAGNSGSHQVKLVEVDDETDVAGAAVVVTAQTGTPGEFIYAPLPTPVTLAPGKVYYVVSHEDLQGDRWHDLNSRVFTTDVAITDAAVFSEVAFYAPVGQPGQCYGPVDFKYAVGGGAFPPSVRVTAPREGDQFLTPVDLGLEADATTSADSSITNVEFYANSVKLGEDASPPFGFLWALSAPATGGIYALRAVATDSFGKVGTSAVVNIRIVAPTPLVAFGSSWSYLDTGADPGPGWTGGSFEDHLWLSNEAPFGYGIPGLQTIVSFGPDPNSRHITTYFRKRFFMPDVTAFTDVRLELRRDDGAVVYINGELFSSNNTMPPIGPATRALTDVGDAPGASEESFQVPYGLLENGTNILAVEVHQFAPDSSDLAFDLQLLGAGPVWRVTRGPYLQKGTPTSVVVRWRSDVASSTVVRYGTAPVNLEYAATRIELTTEHEMALTDLVPDTKYYYSVGSVGFPVASGSDFFFVTAPLTNKPTRIWVLGDSGTANFNARAVRDAYYALAGSRHTDLWLMLGDNAYSIGTDPEYQAAVFDMYPKMLRKSVLWPAIGNHDTMFSATPPPTLPYFNIFSLPTSGEAGGVASGTEKFYSFNYGSIHFVCLDSMSSDRSTNGVMYAWLQNDLEANDRDWLIAFWHHPPYTKGSHDSDNEPELIAMRETFLPLLEAFGVDLVLGGHSHCYERSFLLRGHYGQSPQLVGAMILAHHSGRVDEGGSYEKPVSGPYAGAGAVYVVAGSSGQATFGQLNHPAMFISLLQLGSLVLDIDGSTLNARFVRENGSVDDSFTIVKQGSENPSAFAIIDYEIHEGMLRLTFRSTPGQHYSVQYTTDPQVRWTFAAGAEIATATTTTRTVPLINNSVGFYRILNSRDD